MKRILLLLALVTASFALAQHPQAAPEGARHEESKHERDLTGWKWANFFILAGLLGWLISKNAGPFFAGRTKAIQKGIAEAAKLKYSAEVQARGIEERLAGLQAEIDAMRAEARQELQAEAERLKADTAQMLAKVQSQAEQDIAAAAKAARQELKAHSAELAARLAEGKLRARLDAAAQSNLVEGFVADLHATRPEVN